jgi:hypothetical protein
MFALSLQCGKGESKLCAPDKNLQLSQGFVNLFTTEEFKTLILFATSDNLITCTRRRWHAFTWLDRAIG